MPSLIRGLAWAYLTCGCASAARSSDKPRDSHERRQDGPVAPGTATDCTYYDTAYDSSFTCGFFEKSWGLTHAEFVDFNPSVKNDCSSIIIGNSYCVEVNFGLPRPTTRSPTPTSTKTSTKPGGTPITTGPAKPSPTQDGLIGTCTKFYFAVSGDTCMKIVEAQRSVFTLADFVSWNPAVKSDCSGLWANTYYCVGIPGTPTAGTSTRPATTKTTTVIKTTPVRPSPTQDGIAANCQRYDLAGSGDTCQKLVNQYGTFTLDQFYAWNPAVGKSCSRFWLGYYYCIGIPGTPTSPTKKVTTRTTTTTRPPADTCNPAAPTPTQPKPTCGCKRWHKVVSGNTCDAIVKKYGITKANFNKWNPGVGSACTSLWLGYYVCVGR